MNEDICRVIWTPEHAQRKIEAIPPEADSYDPMLAFTLREEAEASTSNRHIWKELKSGVFNQQLVGKECIKCGKIVKL